MTGRHSSAVLAYIVSQTRQNVELLISQGQLSLADGREILIKLPPATVFDQAMLSITKQAQEINLSPPNTTSPPIDHASVPGPPIGAYLPLQHSHTYQARALWNYNELGQDPKDLSFRAGDIIEIVTETNTDWWTGRYNGKQGLFPSNYVERINVSVHSPSSPSSSHFSERAPSSINSQNESIHGFSPSPGQPAYQPTGGYQGPPPPNQGGVTYDSPPPGAPTSPAGHSPQRAATLNSVPAHLHSPSAPSHYSENPPSSVHPHGEPIHGFSPPPAPHSGYQGPPAPKQGSAGYDVYESPPPEMPTTYLVEHSAQGKAEVPGKPVKTKKKVGVKGGTKVTKSSKIVS